MKRCIAASLGALVILIPSITEATSYTRGSLYCSNFEETEYYYKEEPEDLVAATDYALCLLAKGGDDFNALYILNNLSQNKNHVRAADLLAKYHRNDGRFEGEITRDHLDEAISAYSWTLILIGSKGTAYPGLDDEIAERDNQMELTSYYLLPLLYLQRFIAGVIGTYNQALLKSPDYQGDRELKTYVKYHSTIYNLKKTIEAASSCYLLQDKKHFFTNYYNNILKACKSLKDTAEKLLFLEGDRMKLLHECRDRLSDCPEHDEVYNKIVDIILEDRDYRTNSLDLCLYCR